MPMLRADEADKLAQAALAAGGQIGAAGATAGGKMAETVQAGKNEQQKAKLEAYLKGQQAEREPELAGQKQRAMNSANAEMFDDPRMQAQMREGASVKAGDLAVGADPQARAALKGPQQAQAFLKHAQGTYKGINDQLDAAQSTIDALNQGNSTSDKIALINEARIAAGQGGSRAISRLVDVLSGGQTSAGTFQDKLNWLQNTPNIPTLQPAQRDAIRESVFARTPQLQQLHQQATQQLSQQGPIVAPTANTAGIIQSYAEPINQKLQGINKLQQEYTAQRQQQTTANPISAPAQANPNPTTLDRLMSVFGGMGKQTQAVAAPPSPTKQVASPRDQVVPQAGGAPQGAMPPQQQPAAAPAKPASVIQNGHTYNLNPTTGQYE